MNYSALLAQINANIKRNGVQAITGQILNAVLRAMVESLGEGFRFGGFALPEDAPESPTFYLLRDGDVIKIKTYTDGSWDETEIVNLADYGTAEDVAELREAVENIVSTTYTKTQIDGKLAGVVHKTGDETINGRKRFGDSVSLGGGVDVWERIHADDDLTLEAENGKIAIAAGDGGMNLSATESIQLFTQNGAFSLQCGGDLSLTSEFGAINLQSFDDATQSELVVEDLVGTILSKADSSNVYTKTEVDGKLAEKADKSTTYTKTETDGLLATKANQSTTYTKSAVDGKLSAKANTADLTALSGRVDSIESVVGDVNELLETI